MRHARHGVPPGLPEGHSRLAALRPPYCLIIVAEHTDQLPETM